MFGKTVEYLFLSTFCIPLFDFLKTGQLEERFQFSFILILLCSTFKCSVSSAMDSHYFLWITEKRQYLHSLWGLEGIPDQQLLWSISHLATKSSLITDVFCEQHYLYKHGVPVFTHLKGYPWLKVYLDSIPLFVFKSWYSILYIIHSTEEASHWIWVFISFCFYNCFVFIHISILLYLFIQYCFYTFYWLPYSFSFFFLLELSSLFKSLLTC